MILFQADQYKEVMRRVLFITRCRPNKT